MPATSEAQRRLFAIAEHHPSQLYKENRGLARLPHKTLHEFAATKGLTKEIGKKLLSRKAT
jgi:hypothetical protein